MTAILAYAFTVLLWGWVVVTVIAVAAYLVYAVLDRLGLTVTDDYSATTWASGDDLEFEAVVRETTEDDELRVEFARGFRWIDGQFCTVIAPPVKAGDLVTADNVDQLRIGAVTLRDEEGCMPYYLTDRGWKVDGHFITDRQFYGTKIVCLGGAS